MMLAEGALHELSANMVKSARTAWAGSHNDEPKDITQSERDQKV